MKISACYIVGENEPGLEKSLKSVNSLVDEIIIIDTVAGGNSSTDFLAKKYKAERHLFSWKDDFSAARNFAIEKARGDWILFLDADEYLFEIAKKSLRNILFSAKMEEIEVILVKIFNIDEDQHNRVVDSFFAPRIFKRKQELRYTGKIHEQLCIAGRELLTTYISEKEMQIYHTGYSTGKLKEKAERNLQLLLRELETGKDPAEIYMALAEAYEGIGEVATAEKYAWLDIVRGRQNITYASRSYRVLLRVLENKIHPDTIEIKNVLKAAVQDFPELPEFHAEYAQYLASELLWQEAIEEMQRALECLGNYTSIEPTNFGEEEKKIGGTLLQNWQEKQKQEQKLKISACVITKNEEQEIARWIENMRQFSDEQIIVDTGSADRTIEIAESYGITVYQYVWQDNFADAKNFAIAKAKGDWIAFLDADEYFSADTVGNARAVVAAAQVSEPQPDAIMCPKVNIDVDKNNMELGRFMELRLFRNLPALRYHGKIHECIQHEKRNLEIYVEKKRLKMYHTGYSTKRVEEKLRRNLKLLQQDIAQNGEGPQHYRYLLDCYHVLGEHAKAVKYGKLHLASQASSIGMESQVYINLINSMIFLQTKEEEICKYIEEAIERFPDLPDFHACFAGSMLRQGKFRDAKKYLLKALEIYENNFLDNTDSSNFSYMLTDVYSNLADIAHREADYAQEKMYLDRSLQKNKYNRVAFKQVYAYIKGKDIEDQSEILSAWYQQDKEDLLFLLAEIEEIEISEIYFYYVEILKKRFGIFSAKSQFYEKLKGKYGGDAFSFAVSQGVKNLELSVYGAMCLDRWEQCKELESVLPAALFHCIQRYYGVLAKLSAGDLEGYKILLGILVKLHPQPAAFWETFIEMAKDFSANEVPGFIDLLFTQEGYYPIQFLETEQVQDYTEGCSLQVGIALYHCQKYERAKAYLQRIKENANDIKEARAYVVWIEGKIGNECV